MNCEYDMGEVVYVIFKNRVQNGTVIGYNPTTNAYLIDLPQLSHRSFWFKPNEVYLSPDCLYDRVHKH
jgi:hypothetical protein